MYDLAWAEIYMERFDGSLRHSERGIAISQASGQGHLLVPLMLARAYALVARGRCAEASELAETAEDAARLSANPQSLAWALWVRRWPPPPPATTPSPCARARSACRWAAPSTTT